MTSNLKVWKKLYELSEQVQQLKPWEHMWSSDYVRIEIAPNDYVYCVIMGKNKECLGISLYEGESGYEDLLSIGKDYHNSEVSKYVMFEQTCLTWYLGNRDEVPSQQIDIIKELGLKFREKNAWPYFICYEKQYSPYTFNDQEARRVALILERLLNVLKDYIDNKIDIDFEKEEIIYAHKENKKWIYEAIALPVCADKYTTIELSDDSIYTQLQKQKKTYDELYIDLHYMNTAIKDNQYKKPINALMFIVVDAKSQVVVQGNLIQPIEDEVSVVLNFIINHILEKGIPNTLYVRNPTVFIAVDTICSCCGISLKMDGFDIVDNIYEQMQGMIK